MLKLIKYEFIKKSKLLLILLITAILANLAVAVAFGEYGIGLFLGLTPIALIILYLYELIRTYSDDLNKKTGYMLFMTPNSGYKIIGSKLIFIITEGLILFVSYLIFLFINICALALKATGDFSEITHAVNEIINAVNSGVIAQFGINLGDVLLIVLMILVSAIVFTLIVYSAMTIRKSIFSDIKYGGIISFIIFIGLNYVYGKLANLISTAFQFEVITERINTNFAMTYPSSAMFEMFGITIAFNVIISILLLLGSGYLIEKKINL
jgi:hypothetical protein